MVNVPHSVGIASNQLVTPLIGALHSSTVNSISVVLYMARWVRIAQSVWRLATGWTVWGRIPVEMRFSAPVQTSPGAYPASYMIGTGSFLGVKHPGCSVDHPPLSSAEVKKRVELYLYFLWAFVDFTRVNCTFYLLYKANCDSLSEIFYWLQRIQRQVNRALLARGNT